MADESEFSDFGAHFLSSMLEVELTEDANAHEVSDLPPIPMFDLQSPSFSFSEMIQNPINEIPVPVKPPPQIIKPKLLPKPPVVPSSLLTTTPKARSTLATPDSIQKSFVSFLLNPQVKKVFCKEDVLQPSLSIVGTLELDYHKSAFKDLKRVEDCKLHCTICDKHIGCSNKAEQNFLVHKMLSVIVCRPCYDFYGDGNFPCDEGDNCEIYCRWCGQGGTQVCCSFCPKVFCKKCVKLNYGAFFLTQIEKASDWACFCCASKPLWPHRAICRALVDYITQKKVHMSTWPDATACCKKNKMSPVNQKQKQKVGDKTKTPQAGHKQLMVRNFADINKMRPIAVLNSSPALLLKPHPGSLSPNLPFDTSNIVKTFMLPQNMKKQINCGQTTITPPAARSLIKTIPPPPPLTKRPTPARPIQPATNAKPAQAAPPRGVQPTAVVRSGPSSVDMSKIPVAKVPHNVHGLVLRINFPDTTVQLLRLLTDEECPAGKKVVLPSFGLNPGPIETSVADAFQLTKKVFERLVLIKNKLPSNKPSNKDMYASTVKKMRELIQHTKELLGDIDDDLSSRYEEWTKKNSSVDVIDLSDDEGTAKLSKFAAKSKDLWKDDSDIEIIEEDDVKVNQTKEKKSQTPQVTSQKKEVVTKKFSINLVKLSDTTTPKRKRRSTRAASKRRKLAGDDSATDSEAETTQAEKNASDKENETSLSKDGEDANGLGGARDSAMETETRDEKPLENGVEDTATDDSNADKNDTAIESGDAAVEVGLENKRSENTTKENGIEDNSNAERNESEVAHEEEDEVERAVGPAVDVAMDEVEDTGEESAEKGEDEVERSNGPAVDVAIDQVEDENGENTEKADTEADSCAMDVAKETEFESADDKDDTESEIRSAVDVAMEQDDTVGDENTNDEYGDEDTEADEEENQDELTNSGDKELGKEENGRKDEEGEHPQDELTNLREKDTDEESNSEVCPVDVACDLEPNEEPLNSEDPLA